MKPLRENDRNRVLRLKRMTKLINNVNKHRGPMSTIIESHEIVGRQLEGCLNNFYAGFTRGPYSVKQYRPTSKSAFPLNDGIPAHLHTHAVYDGNGIPVLSGTESECAHFAERFNLAYAKHLMTK